MSKNINLAIEIDSLSVSQVAKTFREESGWTKEKVTHREIAQAFLENLLERYFHAEYLDTNEVIRIIDENSS